MTTAAARDPDPDRHYRVVHRFDHATALVQSHRRCRHSDVTENVPDLVQIHPARTDLVDPVPTPENLAVPLRFVIANGNGPVLVRLSGTQYHDDAPQPRSIADATGNV